jgi:hypothetical protein
MRLQTCPRSAGDLPERRWCLRAATRSYSVHDLEISRQQAEIAGIAGLKPSPTAKCGYKRLLGIPSPLVLPVLLLAYFVLYCTIASHL